MKKLFFTFLTIALVLVTGFSGCSSAPETVEKITEEVPASAHLKLGGDLYNNYSFDQAVKEYTEAIKKDPEMAEAYIGRANVYSGRLEQSKALADYQTGADKDQNYSHYAAGYKLFTEKKYDSAIEEFTLSIEQDSNNLAAYNDRGLCYANLGKQDQAIKDYDEALKINSKSAFVYNNRGNAYTAKKDYDNAISDYSKAIELYPVLVYPYSGRGYAYIMKKDFDRAIADLTKAIAITPNDESLYIMRGDAYTAKGERALADADYSKADSLKK